MTPSPLARYSALLQRYLDWGYSQLGASEAIQAAEADLWQAAEAERRRQVLAGTR